MIERLNANVFGMSLMAIAFLIFTGVSFALLITYKILKKYSDIGDSSCDIKEYSRTGIHYNRRIDDAATNEKYFLFADYGVNPYLERKHNIPEVLLKNAEKDKHQFGNRGQES
jgi:hypothetical protein